MGSILSMFNVQQKTLAGAFTSAPKAAEIPKVSEIFKPKPGDFPIKWPKFAAQQPKDYRAIITADELRAYCKRCQETGTGGFDYETAADEQTRAYYLEEIARIEAEIAEAQEQVAAAESNATDAPKGEKQIAKKALSEARAALKTLNTELEKKIDEFDKVALDPWKSEIVAFSLAANPHEARAVLIDLKPGPYLFEPTLRRDKARRLALEILNDHFYRSARIRKIAFNLAFETKFTAKYGKYILMPVADPGIALVRCQQIATPNKIKNPKKPNSGKGLKPMTKEVFGVNMTSFTDLLQRHGAKFFSDLPADEDALLYSCEDSDYAVQHDLYWMEVARQIPEYENWLNTIEMPFMRVIGLMEYHGMAWDDNLAQQKQEEAEIMMEQAAEQIKALAKGAFGLDINPGKTGKTGDVRHLIFDVMKIPATKWGKEGASLDEESILDMKFCLENKLETLDEEKYLSAELPEDWESRDPDQDPHLDKQQRQLIRIKRRPEHPHKDTAIRLLDLVQKIQTYSTLLSSHIIGRAKFLNEISGRIHAHYGVWTETGRCNCFQPNGQNVPRTDNDVFGIRNFYVPAPGKILFFIDFSGFELRLMAWKSGDETMLQIFNTGGDIHRRTASEITGKPEEEVTKKERTDAKPANFGIAYGGTEHALQKQIKVEYGQRKSLDECLHYVNAVKRAYPRIPEYQRNITLEAREKGYVQTIYGYIRRLPHINSPSQTARDSDARRAANTPIQGTAADVMKKCQNAVYEKIGEDTALANMKAQAKIAEDVNDIILCHGHTDMIGQIHDEIIFEMDDDPNVVERAAAWVKSMMEQPPLPDFPVKIEAEASVGYRWGQKQSVAEWMAAKRGA
jgi:DNA polymerase-1